jgi:hypothetical protein
MYIYIYIYSRNGLWGVKGINMISCVIKGLASLYWEFVTTYVFFFLHTGRLRDRRGERGDVNLILDRVF